MSERTCEINGKIFEGIPCNEDAESMCQGCVGYDNPDMCNQLANCLSVSPYAARLSGSIIWVVKQ